MQAPDDFDPPIGVAEDLVPGLRRIVAPNPSPMTYRGTNTYILGTRDLAVIDPGPLDTDHLKAIMRACRDNQKITHIIVSHSHLDHAPLAKPLSELTGAPVLAFGNALAGRSSVMTALARSGMVDGGEGVDSEFAPDRTLADGQMVSGSDWQLEVIHTPGHLGNHICLAWGDTCFTADHVMGWASSLVSPPDGDLTDFMSSCARLRTRHWSRFYPGHGAQIDMPQERLDWLINHRLGRETSILQAISRGAATAADVTRRVYTDVPPALLPAAERNVLAHLIDLMGKSKVQPLGPLTASTLFQGVELP